MNQPRSVHCDVFFSLYSHITSRGAAFFRVYGQPQERLCSLPVSVPFRMGSAEINNHEGGDTLFEVSKTIDNAESLQAKSFEVSGQRKKGRSAIESNHIIACFDLVRRVLVDSCR